MLAIKTSAGVTFKAESEGGKACKSGIYPGFETKVQNITGLTKKDQYLPFSKILYLTKS